MMSSETEPEDRARTKIMARFSRDREITGEELYRLIDETLEEESRDIFLPLSEKCRLREKLYNSFKKLDVLQELLDDETVTEIMINGPERIFIEQNGRVIRWNGRFESEEKLENIIQQIVSRVNRRVNTASPIVDARLEDGSRVNVCLPPVAVDGPCMTIRKFPEPITVEKLIRYGSLTPEAADFLETMVRARYNIFVSGGTSSGKTTLLNALSQYIPSSERIITIEDSAELQITHIPNLVRLETRDQNSEGRGQIDMSMLIKTSLRMRPDRIIIGEVRDRSAADMLAAFDTGHDGSLSTGHANSSKDMLTRLESMVLQAVDIPLEAIRKQISGAIEIMVHLERLSDGKRRVTEINEVTGFENGEITLSRLYRYDMEEHRLLKEGQLKNKRKLLKAGFPQSAGGCAG